MNNAMESFFTRERANEGIEVPLYLPSGEKSEHWIRIRGVDSDIFRQAETEAKRDAIRIAQISDKVEQLKAMTDAKLHLLAVLVISWSFPQECTEEAVTAFFRQAPQIADAVDAVASRRALFFANGSKGSQSTQNTSSSSTDTPKEVSSPSEQA